MDVAERRNKTLLDIVRSMMAQANLPISFWGDALLTAAYILNRVPSQSVSSTPYELWKGEKPNLEHLHPWGSAGYVMYGEHPNGGMTELELRDIDFIETDFPSIGDANRDLDLYELEEDEGMLPSSSEGGGLVPRPVIAEDSGSALQPSGSITLDQDSQAHRVSSKGHIPRRHFEIKGNVLLYDAKDVDEPASFSTRRASWRKAIPNKEGIDYEDTFSPVVRFASIRLILSIVAKQDLELFQMDAKTAFLNGELDEEIYMAQPAGFEVQGHERKVCRLKRSIYGLKQSSRQWYLRFHDSITSFGFEMIEEDHCVYLKRSKRSILILSLYVDDILLAGNDMDSIVTTKKWLSSTFEMKDMGTYIKKILERFHMHNSKPINTPMEKGCTLSLDQCPKNDEEKNQMSKVPYASAIGSLMYAMLCTCPDICFAVGMVSRYQSNPGPAHCRAVKRILRYLRGTIDHALCYHGGDLRLTGYSDADWASDKDERKSTSGYAFILGGGAVSWCSKKQSCIALSTMESEYVALFSSCPGSCLAKEIFATLGMVADPLTKPIARDLFFSHAKSMGLRRI
uniref:Reverse transcriptase Ty1/copia-type domain-containing protein n=1 Tax=Fagus sylvatica TaxID=28930 RepID=A0A2N9I383_FAGSY